MPNTILTPTAVTREALRVLHQKLNFITNINTQYDSQFAKSGAKIGSQLNIRLPNEYTVRSGATLSAQDTVETSTALNVTTQKGVDLNFTSVDLTLSLDDFSKRIIQPAMSVLAATMEADALGMTWDVYNNVFNIGAATTFAKVMGARKQLVDNLTPMDNNVTALLNTQDNVDLVDALKGLFQDSSAIKQQYKDGMMGRTAGFDFYENTLMPTKTSGTTISGTTAYTLTAIVSGGTAGNSLIPVSGATTTFVVGDIITVAGLNRCHPETKADTGVLQPFVVVSAYAGGTGNIQVSPTIWTSTGRQNIFTQAAAGGALSKVTGGNANVIKPSLFFHRDAFVFATADLQMPQGVDWSAREQMDGLSIRMVRQYDITNDKFPCRLDVLYGFKTVRPQLAARLHSN